MSCSKYNIYYAKLSSDFNKVNEMATPYHNIQVCVVTVTSVVSEHVKRMTDTNVDTNNIRLHESTLKCFLSFVHCLTTKITIILQMQDLLSTSNVYCNYSNQFTNFTVWKSNFFQTVMTVFFCITLSKVLLVPMTSKKQLNIDMSFLYNFFFSFIIL